MVVITSEKLEAIRISFIANIATINPVINPVRAQGSEH
jgi:hypothetical protein